MSELIARAISVAAWAHRLQPRKYTQEPYIVHPIRVMSKLHDLFGTAIPDYAMAAAVCHDVLEDTAYSEAEMRVELGDKVTNLVVELTDVSRPEDGNRAARKAKDREHIGNASVLAQYIKAADILDNMQDIAEHDKNFAVAYIRECLQTVEKMTKLPRATGQLVYEKLIETGKSLEPKEQRNRK